MIINEQGTFYVEGEYAQGDTILTAGDWELVADVDGYKKYAFGYEPSDFPELVTNGTFDTDISGWSAREGGGTEISFDDGKMRVTSLVSTTTIWGEQSIPTTSGSKYTASMFFDPNNSSFQRHVRIMTPTNIAPVALSEDATIAGIYSVSFFASTTSMRVAASAYVNTTGSSILADNVSVKLAHPKAGDIITLGNGNHKDFRYYPKKLSQNEVLELVK